MITKIIGNIEKKMAIDDGDINTLSNDVNNTYMKPFPNRFTISSTSADGWFNIFKLTGNNTIANLLICISRNWNYGQPLISTILITGYLTTSNTVTGKTLAASPNYSTGEDNITKLRVRYENNTSNVYIDAYIYPVNHTGNNYSIWLHQLSTMHGTMPLAKRDTEVINPPVHVDNTPSGFTIIYEHNIV